MDKNLSEDARLRDGLAGGRSSWESFHRVRTFPVQSDPITASEVPTAMLSTVHYTCATITRDGNEHGLPSIRPGPTTTARASPSFGPREGKRYAARQDQLLGTPDSRTEAGPESEMPTIHPTDLTPIGAVPAIDCLAYFARELAFFASYTLALFSQNEIVTGS